MTSRELVRSVLSSVKVPRTPFIPLICIHAARLEQVPVRKMFTDPSLLARSLQNAQRLYGYDAVLNTFDMTLEAEACGCKVAWGSEGESPSIVTHPMANNEAILQSQISAIETMGRLPVVIEATRRLKVVLGQTVALVAVVTGPLKLAAHLKGTNVIQEIDENNRNAIRVLELAGQVVLKVCQAYCEFEPDVIAVADDLLSSLPPRHLPLACSVLRPVWNLSRFYNASCILLTRQWPSNNLEDLPRLGADGTLVGGEINLANLEKSKLMRSHVIGIGIPNSKLVASKEEIQDYIRGWLDRKYGEAAFLSTEWEVPYDTPPENLHTVMRTIAP